MSLDDSVGSNAYEQRLWNVVINRLLLSTVFMQLLMLLSTSHGSGHIRTSAHFYLHLAVGLVHGWKTYLWTTIIPPILFVIIFKMWLTRTYMNAFRYYVPDEREIARSKVHSEGADAGGSRLQKRFGHPALHAELFTPMVHANMVSLLPQVYHGRLSEESAGLNEYGNQKVSASVLPGGLKIAGIEQVRSLFCWTRNAYSLCCVVF